MHAAALRLELRIPGARSLKDKRRILKAVQSGITRRFPVAVAEVDFQDQWRRATIGVAVVGGEAGHVRRLLHSVTQAVAGEPEVELLETAISYLEEMP